MTDALYTSGFYEAAGSGASRSANVIVPAVLELTSATSVIDVGCGNGTWAAAFLGSGVDAFGVDGPWVPDTQMVLPLDRFTRHDLSRPYAPGRRYDLAVCLEVAEHLDPAAGHMLVDTLTGLAETVFFSAAIPRQGGTHHVNEQWPDHWADLFAAKGYRCFDPLRARLWEDDRVAVCYRQNVLFFSSAPTPQLVAWEVARPQRLVHPEKFLAKMNYVPTLRESLHGLAGSVRESVRYRRQAVRDRRAVNG